MVIYLGADHRGFALKTELTQWLKSRSDTKLNDLGVNTPTSDDDYNDPAIAVAQAVLKDPDSFGVLICGSSQGMCMQSNRFKGIRAISCHTAAEAALARQHHNANVLCLAADDHPSTIDPYRTILDAFLASKFLGHDRYIRRNQKLDKAII